MKVIFMGTPEIAANILRIVAQHHQIVCAYTQPPRPAGRDMKLRPSDVQQVAEELGIPVKHPISLKTPEAQSEFQSFNADIAVVCAYGLILPQTILDAPKLGCYNIHASLLPRWRGAAPIQRAIEAGDAESGITIMRMDAGLDTGDILLQQSTPITPDTTAGELHDTLMRMGGDLILRALQDQPSPIPQPAEGITYAEKIRKEETRIDWNKPAHIIERTIRAFNPYPATYFTYNSDRIRVFGAEVEQTDTDAIPGTVLDDNLLIACGRRTALRLLQLQRAGKKPMSATELLNGWQLPKGTKLAV